MSAGQDSGWPSCEGWVHYPWSYPQDVQDRIRLVFQRAVEVFGNAIDAGVWESGHYPQIGGGRNSVRALVCEGADYAQQALSELERLAAITEPREKPESGWVGKRRSRRRWK